MDYNYLYSVVEFYLKNETDNDKANLEISKESGKVLFKLGMDNNQFGKSSYDVPLYLVNNYIEGILKLFKGDLLIIDEKYNLNNLENTCHYFIKFKNGRTVTFEGFSVLEINNIRNVLYNVTLNKDEIRVDLKNPNEIQMNYEPRLQETGFASFSQLFLLVLFVSDIIAVGLWIFVLIFGK